MFHDIPPEMNALVSMWCCTLLYGITIVLYITCIYVLIKRRGDRSSSATWILSGTATVQFILSTIYDAVTFRQVIEGFIYHSNVPNGPFLYFIDPAVKLGLISKAIYFTNNTIADSILIWRVYMVWGKNIYVCVIPIIIACSSTVTGYIAFSKVVHITANLTPTSLFQVLNWGLANWSLSIATQVISTGLIAGKIWWHAKHNHASKSRYIPIIAIIVESGAIFTISTVFLLAFADLKSQVGGTLADMSSQIATIVPTLLILRVEMIRDKTSDTMKCTNLIDLPDLIAKEQVPGRQLTAFKCGDPPAEISVHTTTADVSNYVLRQKSKYSV